MIKKLISALILALILMFAPVAVLAQEGVCVTQYGGGVVCGVSTPHEPVSAGLGDFNILVIGAIFILLSLTIQFFTKKVRVH